MDKVLKDVFFPAIITRMTGVEHITDERFSCSNILLFTCEVEKEESLKS